MMVVLAIKRWLIEVQIVLLPLVWIFKLRIIRLSEHFCFIVYDKIKVELLEQIIVILCHVDVVFVVEIHDGLSNI